MNPLNLTAEDTDALAEGSSDYVGTGAGALDEIV